MSIIIDRRKNTGQKAIVNRQRFIRRAKEAIKKQVDNIINNKNIRDIADDVYASNSSRTPKSGNTNVTIPRKDIKEYSFQHGKGGSRDYVLPGNKDLIPGDKIKKPQGGGGGNGTEGGQDGEGEDDFTFTLTQKEFLEFFLEDLELPELVKTNLKDATLAKPHRAGFTTTGNPANLDLIRTMKNAIGRRIALQTPFSDEILALTKQLDDEKNKEYPDDQLIVLLEQQLINLKTQQENIPFVDNIDLRYRTYERKPEPTSKAVMFCLMDVSGSMGEYEKTLAKKFFMLLYLFLNQKYEKVDLVFICHHSLAKEVDEQEFFYGQETGGTVVSTALELMYKIINERYPTSDWNIYGSQVTDGDNFSGDTPRCIDLLNQKLIPLVQYFAYIQVAHQWSSTSLGELWHGYHRVHSANAKQFNMAIIEKPDQLYPVFRELFKGKST